MNTYMFIRKVKALLEDKNDGRVKHGISSFFDNQEAVQMCSVHTLGISKIETKTKRKYVKVTVILSRPGLLIGKQGSTLDALVAHLSRLTEKPVKIFIKEFDPFM